MSGSVISLTNLQRFLSKCDSRYAKKNKKYYRHCISIVAPGVSGYTASLSIELEFGDDDVRAYLELTTITDICDAIGIGNSVLASGGGRNSSPVFKATANQIAGAGTETLSFAYLTTSGSSLLAINDSNVTSITDSISEIVP